MGICYLGKGLCMCLGYRKKGREKTSKLASSSNSSALPKGKGEGGASTCIYRWRPGNGLAETTVEVQG